jgi:hypothetical protein
LDRWWKDRGKAIGGALVLARAKEPTFRYALGLADEEVLAGEGGLRARRR